MPAKKSLFLILSVICISIFSYFIYDKVQYEYVVKENDINKNISKNDLYKSILFENDLNNIKAKKELYKYTNNENIDVIKDYQKSCPKKSVRAAYFDLNNDKVPEIIGFVNCNFYQGTVGTKLFILSKTSNGYENLTYLTPLYPEYGIRILKHTTNSYHDIEVVAGHIPDDGSSVIPDKAMSVTFTFDGKNY